MRRPCARTAILSLVALLAAIAVSAAAGGSGAEQASPQLASSTTVYLPAVADATLYGDSPGSPGGTGSFLTAAYYHSDGIHVSSARILLVKFDLTTLPYGAIIESAVLQLYHNSCALPGTYPVPLGAFFVTSAWSEGSVTYASRPTWESIGINAQVGCTPGAWAEWGITSFAQAWRSDPAHNYGVKVSGPWFEGWNYYISFNSRELSYGQPRLAVTYRLPATATPTKSPATATPTRRPVTKRYLPTVMKQHLAGTIFSDDFSSGALAAWTPNLGAWTNPSTYMRGEYAAGNAWNMRHESGRNFIYEGTVNLLSGNAVGLTFRSSPDGTSSYDAILDAADGMFKISKRPPYTVLDQYPMVVQRNHQYRIKVVANGNMIEAYLDGVKRLSATDGTFAMGRFGVMLYRATAAYDNLVARALP